jgi:amidase
VLAFAGALEQAELVRRGEVSSEELVRLYLDRIEALDPQLNAFVTVCAERALEEARAPRPVPFAGVTLPIKDLTDTEGIRTTRSSVAFAEHVPTFDAAVVRRLRAAGFVVIGKTNTPEFGLVPLTHSELNGVCRNPWNRALTPGGSSGGAAAAVAAGLAPAAHGSDGGGSIRIPASCCGLYGLKPSRGRISPAPYGDLYGLSTSGALTRTVADTAAMLDATAGNEPGDPYVCPPPARPFLAEVGADPGRLRIAVTTRPPMDVAVDPACAAAATDAAELLAGLGHEVEQAEPPWRCEELLELFAVVWQTIPLLYGPEVRFRLGPVAAALADAADATPSGDYLLAFARLQALARQVVSFWAGYDLVLTPTLALPPVPVDWNADAEPWTQFRESIRFTPFTPIVNVTGQPAASLPLHWSDDGLPIGVQLIGRPADEATILRVSAQLEQARPWRDRRPPEPAAEVSVPSGGAIERP